MLLDCWQRVKGSIQQSYLMGLASWCATIALVILMDQLAKEFDEKFVMPFTLVDLMFLRKIMITYLLHMDELDLFYCLSLVNMKTLKVA